MCTRTVRRHLGALVRAGEAERVREGRAWRYALAPGAARELALPQLSEAEAEALTLAAMAAEALLGPTPFGGPLRAARAALCRTWLYDVFAFEPEAEAEHWDFDGAAGGEPPAEGFARLRTLVQAVRDRCPVRATYFTARSGTRSARTLHPLGVFVRSGSWIVAAWCARSGCVKDFALGGFEDVEVDEAGTFAPPPGFSLAGHVRDRFGAMSGSEVHEVRLRVEPAAIEAFRRKMYHPTQQVDPPGPDGAAEASFEVAGLEGIAAFVRSWGPAVRVLAPPELAARVAADARATAALYPPA